MSAQARSNRRATFHHGRPERCGSAAGGYVWDSAVCGQFAECRGGPADPTRSSIHYWPAAIIADARGTVIPQIRTWWSGSANSCGRLLNWQMIGPYDI